MHTHGRAHQQQAAYVLSSGFSTGAAEPRSALGPLRRPLHLCSSITAGLLQTAQGASAASSKPHNVAAPAATDCLLRRWLPDFQLGYPGVHITPRLLLIKFNSVYQLQKVYRWRLLECLLA